MIQNEAQLEQTLEQMGRMCQALSVLRQQVLPQSREQFALMAEGPLEELRRLERDVSAYVGQSLPDYAGDEFSPGVRLGLE